MAFRENSMEMIAGVLERQIAHQVLLDGQYLPSIRKLSGQLGCSSLTTHRAMRHLAKKGIVTAEPRQGYRVAKGGARPPRSGLVAFLEETEDIDGNLGPLYQAQMRVLQQEAMRRNWTVVLVPYQRQSTNAIAEQLAKIGATALVLQDVNNRIPKELFASLAGIGLPTICLDDQTGQAGMDHVLRDEAHGASLAAEHLLRRGHRNIGWFGPLRRTTSARRRFAGAAEVMIREGLEGEFQKWPIGANSTAHDYLARKDRPPAVLALWDTAALELANAALELGLTLGQDLDIVGWSISEHYESLYAARCPELARSCATVTWLLTDVARSVLDRIEARQRTPDLPAANILLPMKLRGPMAVVPHRRAVARSVLPEHSRG